MPGSGAIDPAMVQYDPIPPPESAAPEGGAARPWRPSRPVTATVRVIRERRGFMAFSCSWYGRRHRSLLRPGGPEESLDRLGHQTRRDRRVDEALDGDPADDGDENDPELVGREDGL